MKIFIKTRIVLKSLSHGAKERFHYIVKEKSNDALKYLCVEREIENKDENVFDIILAPHKDEVVGIFNVNEKEMIFLLDIFDNHYYGKMFIEHLGNGRFDLIFER